MNRPLRVSLIVLPWVLLAGMAFLAWLAWVHFQWKDRTLWERMLGDVEAAPHQIDAVNRGESDELLDALRTRLRHDCDLIRDEGDLAPAALQPRIEQALRQCPPVDHRSPDAVGPAGS